MNQLGFGPGYEIPGARTSFEQPARRRACFRLPLDRAMVQSGLPAGNEFGQKQRKPGDGFFRPDTSCACPLR